MRGEKSIMEWALEYLHLRRMIELLHEAELDSRANLKGLRQQWRVAEEKLLACVEAEGCRAFYPGGGVVLVVASTCHNGEDLRAIRVVRLERVEA